MIIIIEKTILQYLKEDHLFLFYSTFIFFILCITISLLIIDDLWINFIKNNLNEEIKQQIIEITSIIFDIFIIFFIIHICFLFYIKFYKNFFCINVIIIFTISIVLLYYFLINIDSPDLNKEKKGKLFFLILLLIHIINIITIYFFVKNKIIENNNKS